jgi:hypothetical protein
MFLSNRAIFEQLVNDVENCPGVEKILPVSNPSDPATKCKDHNSQLPEKMSLELRSLKLLWAVVEWGTYGQPEWDPTKLYSVSFVIESYGLLANGSAVSISYSAAPFNDAEISAGWLPLTDRPAHWAYNAIRN